MPYKLIIAKRVHRQINKLPPSVQPRISAAIKALITNPRPIGAAKMKGRSDEYRVRTGRYQIVYRISDEQRTVDIVKCQHRKDVYKDKD